MKKLFLALMAISICLFMVSSAAAQDEKELHLSLSRDFGYGGLGNDIQGLFSMKISDPPENLVKVEFMIDGQVIFTDSEPPYKVQFSTDSYSLGRHTLSAVGSGSDWTQYSNEIVVDFVAAEEGWKAAVGIIGPVFGILALVILATFVIPIFLVRRRNQSLPLGAPRSYGLAGGTICPKCKRPFGIHFFAPNVLAGKFDLCPHCGKWSIVRRYSQESLDAAVAAELEQAGTQPASSTESEADKLRKALDDSKYHDV